MLAAAFGPPLFSLIYIYTLLTSVRTGKKLAGVILIFIGILGLIITFYAIFALLFASVFCGSAPNGCDAMKATFLRDLSVVLLYGIFFISCILSGKNLLKQRPRLPSDEIMLSSNIPPKGGKVLCRSPDRSNIHTRSVKRAYSNVFAKFLPS